MAYEALSKRDFYAVGDLVREAKLAEKEGAGRGAFEHVKRAIHKRLLPSDVPWAEMAKRLQHPTRRGPALRNAPVPSPEPDQELAETPERGRDYPGYCLTLLPVA